MSNKVEFSDFVRQRNYHRDFGEEFGYPLTFIRL